jgi:prolyl-tRNA editing enzyme YbaK/EbsC (Cys-tRNA(Pro) deacylase)
VGPSSATERVRTALAERDLFVEIIEFPESTRTAVEAARAVGATVGQIVKSLVFVADGQPVLALASGAHRVDPDKLARAAAASRVEKATAETTRSVTGFSIGGVPPVGHLTALRVFVDEALLRHRIVYAAAGTPHAVFAVEPQALVRVTQGEIADLAEARDDG